MSDFIMDSRDIRRLGAYFKDAPEALSPAVRKSLNHLARRTIENDKSILRRTMTVRDERFLNNSLRTRDARGNRIQSLEAAAFSIERDRFTGWKEQQDGGAPMKRTATIASRGGNKRRTMLSHGRLRPGNRIVKPQQFQGRTLQSRFSFMMRVLGSRGGRQGFILDHDYHGRRSILRAGLYGLQNHRIRRFQSFDNTPRRPIPWRTRSLQLLKTNHNLESVWQRELEKWVNRYK